MYKWLRVVDNAMSEKITEHAELKKIQQDYGFDSLDVAALLLVTLYLYSNCAFFIDNISSDSLQSSDSAVIVRIAQGTPA